jgi:fructan beta-fructosidase
MNLHVFVDASSVQVFLNDGERVLTAISFPSGESRGVELGHRIVRKLAASMFGI